MVRHMQGTKRRGVSTLFIVGCVLWVLVFAGLFAVRYLRNQPQNEEMPEGTISESEKTPQGGSDDTDDGESGKPRTIVLEIGAERRKAIETRVAEKLSEVESLEEARGEADAAVGERTAAAESAKGTDEESAATEALGEAESALDAITASLAKANEELAVLEIRLEAAESGWSPDGLPDFELTERSGRTVTRDDLLGKPYVVAFVFTSCPGPCPLVSKRMYELQEATRDLDLRLVTITVDPERDTPEVLQRYSEIYSADEDRWLFLTGPLDVIYPLIGNGFAMPVKKRFLGEDKSKYDVVHTSNLIYVDANGIVRGKYNSLDDEAFTELKRRLRKEVPKVEDS